MDQNIAIALSVIGWIGFSVALVAQIPQPLRVLYTRSVKGLTIWSILFAFVTGMLWLVMNGLTHYWPGIISCLVSAVGPALLVYFFAKQSGYSKFASLMYSATIAIIALLALLFCVVVEFLPSMQGLDMTVPTAIVGPIAMVLGLITQYFQLYKMIKTKTASNLAYGMLYIGILSQLLNQIVFGIRGWVYYHPNEYIDLNGDPLNFILTDWVLNFADIFLINGLSIWAIIAKFRYDEKDRRAGILPPKITFVDFISPRFFKYSSIKMFTPWKVEGVEWLAYRDNPKYSKNQRQIYRKQEK